MQLVMSSDQLGSIQEPVVMVDFDISKDGQHTAESVELSKEELDGFVASLEAANKVCIKTTLQSCTVCRRMISYLNSTFLLIQVAHVYLFHLIFIMALYSILQVVSQLRA